MMHGQQNVKKHFMSGANSYVIQHQHAITRESQQQVFISPTDDDNLVPKYVGVGT
jgi:hypothetical protein